jgi:spermidine synthase
MGLFSRRRTRVSAAGDVQISEQDGVRYLHLGSDTIQSGMRIAAPEDLVLSYTRSMLAFLLFVPEPQRVVNVGLGGGSLAKWIYKHLPAAQQLVLEIDPRVIAVARQYFCVPPDDQRLRVIAGDGAGWLATQPDCADVILVDGYDGREQVAELSSADFYRSAAQALRGHGVLVVNLWGNDRRFDTYLQGIEGAFDGQVCCLPAAQRGNVIAMGFKRKPLANRWDQLRERAHQLEAAYGLEFPQFVGALKQLNPHTVHRLLI